MARVELVGNLVQITGGHARFDLPATSIKHLFELLSERYPGLARHLEDGVAASMDGQIYQDALLEPIAPEAARFHVVPVPYEKTVSYGGEETEAEPQPTHSGTA